MVQINLVLDIFSAIIVFILIVSCMNTDEKVSYPHTYFLGILVSLFVILITDYLDWNYNGNKAFTVLLYVSNTINYCVGYLLVSFFMRYLASYLEQWKKYKRIIYSFDVLCGGSIILTISNIFTRIYFYIDSFGNYHRGQLYWLSQFFPILSLLICAIIILFWKGMSFRERFLFFSYPLFPMIGIMIDFYQKGLSLSYTGAVISTLIIYIQIDTMRGKRIAQQEVELSEARIKIMLSQIQPHFLYNALNTIQYLCETDPQKASKTIESFSKYLRGNMDSLSFKEPIPFLQEMEHVKQYLQIETLRFEDVHIVYDLKTTDFTLPALTIQPMVENAIKYGVARKEEGGTVTISTWEDKDYWYVKVADNGTGFDPREVQYDGRSHIGIENTKNRLMIMCSGKMEIESITGEGTSVLLMIPRGGLYSESSCN